jgi:mannitol-specific phosphotransferase system IIBC component
MSGIEEVAIAGMVIGTATAATGQIMKGQEEARSAEFEAQQQKVQRETLAIQAKQDEAKRRNELTSSLETIQAIRAGRGVGESSPGGMALFDQITSSAERDISTSRFNFAQRGEQSRQLSEFSRDRAQTSLLAGYLGAGSTVASSAYQYGRIKKFGY